MKGYVKGKYACTHRFLMGHLDAQAGKSPTSNFACCDLYCQDANLALPIATSAAHTGNTQSVSSNEQKALKGKLLSFRQSFLAE